MALVASCSRTPRTPVASAFRVEPPSIDFGTVDLMGSPTEANVNLLITPRRRFRIVTPDGSAAYPTTPIDWDGLPLDLSGTSLMLNGHPTDEFEWVMSIRFDKFIGQMNKWPAAGREYSGVVRMQAHAKDGRETQTVAIPVRMRIVKGT